MSVSSIGDQVATPSGPSLAAVDQTVVSVGPYRSHALVSTKDLSQAARSAGRRSPPHSMVKPAGGRQPTVRSICQVAGSPAAS
jgi:hypothetical protein